MAAFVKGYTFSVDSAKMCGLCGDLFSENSVSIACGHKIEKKCLIDLFQKSHQHQTARCIICKKAVDLTHLEDSLDCIVPPNYPTQPTHEAGHAHATTTIRVHWLWGRPQLPKKPLEEEGVDQSPTIKLSHNDGIYIFGMPPHMNLLD